MVGKSSVVFLIGQAVRVGWRGREALLTPTDLRVFRVFSDMDKLGKMYTGEVGVTPDVPTYDVHTHTRVCVYVGGMCTWGSGGRVCVCKQGPEVQCLVLISIVTRHLNLSLGDDMRTHL